MEQKTTVETMARAEAAAQGADNPPALNEELLRRMDVPGPRYTSYPTADRFVEAFGPEQYLQALAELSAGVVAGAGGPLSVYVHVPFCESVCYYCACNKIVTRDHGRADPYIDAVAHELSLVTAALGNGQPV